MLFAGDCYDEHLAGSGTNCSTPYNAFEYVADGGNVGSNAVSFVPTGTRVESFAHSAPSSRLVDARTLEAGGESRSHTLRPQRSRSSLSSLHGGALSSSAGKRAAVHR